MFDLPLDRQGWGLALELIRNLVRSEVGGRVVALGAFLFLMLLVINGLNVFNSYVGRDFMTAIADRQMAQYLRSMGLYIAVLGASTITAVSLRYAEERLAFLWRDWMTRRLLELYLRPLTSHRINDALLKSAGLEHPDQRIADDIRVFTTTTLSFTLMVLNAAFSIVAFSGVLWTISPLLFLTALVYAAVGSLVAVLLGRPLVTLNYGQLDKEASFRSALRHVSEHAESVALLHRERRLLDRLYRRFEELGANTRAIIRVNRNLGVFTTGYNYLLQVVPIVVVAPFFINGSTEFGTITQAANAFPTLVGALSLIISQFQSISSFAAVVQRLVNLWHVIGLVQTETVAGIDIVEDDTRVAYDGLTLRSPKDARAYVKDLTIDIPYGTRVRVCGATAAARDALFKATVGILDRGTGKVIRPSRDEILFLPERPYLAPGCLRDALAPGGDGVEVGAEDIDATLELLGLKALVSRLGSLDVEQDWESLLSTGEQHLVSFARILLARPRFAMLYLPDAELGAANIKTMLAALTARGISYLTFARQAADGSDDLAGCYDAVLDLGDEGAWTWQRAPAGGQVNERPGAST